MGILNMDAVKQAKDRMESQSNNSNIGFAKLNQGRNVLRVLFPKGDKSLFYSEGFMHFNLGEDGKTTVTCPKTFGEHRPCPICSYADQLLKSKDKNDQSLGTRLKRRKRVYINVLNRDDEKAPDEPKVLSIGVTILRPLLDVICDPDYGDITHPTDGRDITITKKGAGLKTEYTVVVKPNTSPASKAVTTEELEDQMADLDSLFKDQSVSELEAIISGDGEEDDEPSEMVGGSASESASENGEYDEMELDELKNLCEQRGIAIPEKASKFKLIMYLTQYDESKDDEVMGAIGSAIESRKNK